MNKKTRTMKLLLILDAILFATSLTTHWRFALYAGWVATLIIFIMMAFDPLEEKVDKLLFAKTREDAIIPTKKDDDAGYDIYACFDEDYIEIKSHQTVLIPTGIKTVFDKAYVAILKERGSTGTKGIGQRSGVIDSSFRGEWQVPITNHNKLPIYIIKKDSKKYTTIQEKVDNKKAIIYPYEKAISQALFIPLANLKTESVSEAVIDANKTSRGDGMLGSSGK